MYCWLCAVSVFFAIFFIHEYVEFRRVYGRKAIFVRNWATYLLSGSHIVYSRMFTLTKPFSWERFWLAESLIMQNKTTWFFIYLWRYLFTCGRIYIFITQHRTWSQPIRNERKILEAFDKYIYFEIYYQINDP